PTSRCVSSCRPTKISRAHSRLFSATQHSSSAVLAIQRMRSVRFELGELIDHRALKLIDNLVGDVHGRGNAAFNGRLIDKDPADARLFRLAFAEANRKERCLISAGAKLRDVVEQDGRPWIDSLGDNLHTGKLCHDEERALERIAEGAREPRERIADATFKGLFFE